MKPEAQLQKDVIDLAHAFKWRVAHFRPVRVQRADGSVYYQTPVAADGAGFPDLVLARGGAGGDVLFVELKSDTGQVEAKQREWLDTLRDGGATVYVWKPKHWKSGEIENALR